MDNSFDKNGFVDYLQNNFTMSQRYALDIIDNVIEYGVKNCNASRNELIQFLRDILPDVSFEEIAVYCDD